MKTRGKMILATTMTVIVAVAIAAPAQSRLDRVVAGKSEQLIVRVHRSKKGLEYEIRSYRGLKKGDANYFLAEIKTWECKECQVLTILDDDVSLEAITQVSEMAINAGFKDIRPFVNWRKTGNMAEIQFGPAIRSTTNAEKIEKRISKAR